VANVSPFFNVYFDDLAARHVGDAQAAMIMGKYVLQVPPVVSSKKYEIRIIE
jgi:hypothetical protein